MKIGIDIRMLHYAKTGFYRYVQGILESVLAMDAPFRLILLVHPEFDVSAEPFRDFAFRAVNTPVFSDNESEKFLAEVLPCEFDLIHFPCSLSLDVGVIPAAVTIHDLTCIRYPETMQSEYVTYFKKSIRSKQRDALVITVSETIKSELLGIGYSENQVQRCYPQTPFERPKKYVSRTTIKLQTDKCEIVLDPGEYVMSVGAMEPRKNILTLLRAYQGFRRQVRRTIPFVLISHHGWENEGLKQAIQDMDVERDIYIASHVDDALLASLYANCGACVSAAIYEGFGFVPLEALRYEAPLISGPTPSLLEGGFSNKRMIDQRDHEQFARALGDVFGGRDLFRADQGRFARPVIDYYLGQPRHRMGSLYGEALKGCAVN